MGSFRFRRSKKIGPLTVNLTKTGIGLSAGVPGARASVHSSGRVTKTVGLRGTGLYYRDGSSLGKKKKKGQKVTIPPEAIACAEAIVKGREAVAEVTRVLLARQAVLEAKPDCTDEEIAELNKELTALNVRIEELNRQDAEALAKYGHFLSE